MNCLDTIWEGVKRASGARIGCPHVPAEDWAAVHGLAGDGERPLWAEQYDGVDCDESLLMIAVDFEGTEDGTTCVYATLAVMHNDVIRYHVIGCAPYGEGEVTGPDWLIDLLQRASVVFVFSEEEAKVLHRRGVKNIWDTHPRTARRQGEQPALSDTWSEWIGKGLGVSALIKKRDGSTAWTTRVKEWQAVYRDTSGLSEKARERGAGLEIYDGGRSGHPPTGASPVGPGRRHRDFEAVQQEEDEIVSDHAKWSRYSAWGSNGEPQPPVDEPMCTFQTVVKCPTVSCSSRRLSCGRPGSSWGRVARGPRRHCRRREVGRRSRRRSSEQAPPPQPSSDDSSGSVSGKEVHKGRCGFTHGMATPEACEGDAALCREAREHVGPR